MLEGKVVEDEAGGVVPVVPDERFKHEKTQQETVIRWVMRMGQIWFAFVLIVILILIFSITINFAIFSIKLAANNNINTPIIIALIAAGTSTAVIGPMLVAYAVFRKNLTDNWWGKATQLTNTESS